MYDRVTKAGFALIDSSLGRRKVETNCLPMKQIVRLAFGFVFTLGLSAIEILENLTHKSRSFSEQSLQ
jgi:hypothetical protein